MKLMTIGHVSQLKELDISEYKLIIVEGYDGVGKGKVIRDLVREYGFKVYRPDYSYWNSYLKRPQRWLIFRAFFDVFKVSPPEDTIIMDRGMLSGAVYEKDDGRSRDRASEYAKLIDDYPVLHIFVDTDQESYEKMYRMRHTLRPTDEPLDVRLYTIYQDKYREYFGRFENLQFIEYINKFDETEALPIEGKCGSCDCWNACRQDYDSERVIGICSNPKVGKEHYETDTECKYFEKGDVYAAK